MYVRGDIGWLVCTWLGCCVFCVVTVVATTSSMLQSCETHNLQVGELKEITESFEKLDSGVSIDMTI
jgi:hypothetical protein